MGAFPPKCARRYRAGVIDCAFCAIAAGEKDQPVIAADEHTVAFLDTRPVFKGHVLVIPRVHCRTLADLPRTAAMLAYACGHLFWLHTRYAGKPDEAGYAQRLRDLLAS